MKIYATGMNPADCNALKRKTRITIFQAFVEMMKELREDGNELVWRATKVGDEIPRDIDAVVVSSMLPRSLNCPYALGVIWTISEALRREIPLVIYLTDWAFFRAHAEFKSIGKAGVPYFFKKIGGGLQYAENEDMILQHGEDLIEVCQQYSDPKSTLWQRAQISVPRYTNWGDMKIVQRMLPGANPVHTWDPTPLFTRYILGENQSLPIMDQDGQPKWLLPSLLTDYTWVNDQELEWPIDYYGPKRYPTVETEKDVQELYRQRAGSLCPPYPTEGSGWWRSRWIHAAIAGSVLLCGPMDDRAVGPEYRFSGNDYERMNDRRRLEVSRDQRERMWDLLQLDSGMLLYQMKNAFRMAGA